MFHVQIVTAVVLKDNSSATHVEVTSDRAMSAAVKVTFLTYVFCVFSLFVSFLANFDFCNNFVKTFFVLK